MPPRSSTAEEEYVLVWVEGFGPAFVYDPQQKRIPAGQPGGGRWVDVPWTDLGWDHPDNKPPAPQGNPEGGKPGGYASNGLDVSAAGNVGERIAEKFGVVRDEHRELNEKGELKNQASMDALKPPNYAFEVKTRFTTDGEYRVGMKRGGGERLDEIADKEKWSRENEKKPG